MAKENQNEIIECKYSALQIGNLVAPIPIVQGGMGVGVSLGGLAGSVAKEGGVGIISTAQIGYREPDFEQNPAECNLRAIEKEFNKARAIAQGNGILGFNIMVALKQYEQQVKAAVKAGADIIISGAGLPVDLPAYVGDADTKIAPIVSSAKSAKVILKFWDKRYGKTADMVVIEGPKAGGHLGFLKEEAETSQCGASTLIIYSPMMLSITKRLFSQSLHQPHILPSHGWRSSASHIAGRGGSLALRQ